MSTVTPAAAAAMPLVRIRDLEAWYGSRRALRGVVLDVHAGEILALAGENGAGKSTLVRCVAGDLVPAAGTITLDGERVRPGAKAVARRGVAVVWQDLALCDNLNVASNLLLGRERRRLLLSDARFHAAAADLLRSLDIPIADTTRGVSSLSAGQRQLVAVARAVRDRPRLLVLDEPTAALGVLETAQVEDLVRRLRNEGTTIVLVSHDIDQMFRLADRIAVLRHGEVVADVRTATRHPDEIVALISGQPVDSSPRRQLDRLHSLVGQLNAADAPSGLPVILSALGTALAADRLCIHLLDGGRLRLSAALGMPATLVAAWQDLPSAAGGGPVGAAAARAETVIDQDVRTAPSWAGYREMAAAAGIGSAWAVPVTGAAGLVGVITVFRRDRGTPHHDELDLVTLYAGYAASTAERDGLLAEVTARNRVLETIREVLEQLAGSVPLPERLDIAIARLRVGLGAEEVALLARPPGGDVVLRGWSGAPAGARPSPLAVAAVRTAQRRRDRPGGAPVHAFEIAGRRVLVADVPAPDAPLVLVAVRAAQPAGAGGDDFDASALLEDAARSLQLALERETSERAHREAAALRRSQDLQREFLSRLSHELRTPLTAIHGYADSLLQPDVTWDQESQTRFLHRITTESARLGRLVGDLLDLSAVDANILRLQRDWCDVALVIDAARACLPLEVMDRVEVACGELPAVWADHDRLEQVLVNLMDNAVRHNPPETTVRVSAVGSGWDGDDLSVTITVADDGIGVPDELGAGRDPSGVPRRSSTAGAGLGLVISRAIVDAHGGVLRLDRPARGTAWSVELPVVARHEGDPRLVAAADG